MNKLYLLTIFLLVSTFSFAQVITPSDSTNTGPGNINMVFYNLSTRAQTIPSDTDWHLAISVRETQYPNNTLGGTTIRINEAIGVNVYVAQNADSNSFSTLDTTGWKNWWHLHDADTSIDEGALNSNRNHSNEFDYGWGQYDEYTYNVIGDSIYLIQLPSGEFKKLIVDILVFDTAYNIKYSNLDNSGLQYIHIPKGVSDSTGFVYGDKEFMYLNLEDGTVHDKEPVSNAWDLQFLKYAAVDTLGVQGGTMPVAGVWVNKGDSVAKAAGVDVNSNSYAGLTFSGNLNAIGWNWKPLNDSTGVVQDSLAYFIKTTDGAYYKLIFTGYNDSTGVFDFYSEQITAPAGIQQVNNPNGITIFPNPTSELVNIVLPSLDESTYEITDIAGDVIIAGEAANNVVQVNTSKLAAGVYFVSVRDNESVSTRKLVIEH